MFRYALLISKLDIGSSFLIYLLGAVLCLVIPGRGLRKSSIKYKTLGFFRVNIDSICYITQAIVHIGALGRVYVLYTIYIG